MSTRAEREIIASDQTNMYDNWRDMRMRLRHVFECPNTLYHWHIFDNMIIQSAPGKRILELGCDDGAYSEKLLSFGAAYVRGIDVSSKGIAQAKVKEINGKLEYAVVDASEPVDGVFDIIVGRSVLHHLDYQDALLRLYQRNLSCDGFMLFWEPLGANVLLRVYHIFSKGLHTPDERPFYRRDVQWLKQNFSGFKLFPVNYLSLPLGILSSFIFANPNNALLRVADKIDRLLANNVTFLHAHFRNAIFFIHKPSRGSTPGRSKDEG